MPAVQGCGLQRPVWGAARLRVPGTGGLWARAAALRPGVAARAPGLAAGREAARMPQRCPGERPRAAPPRSRPAPPAPRSDSGCVVGDGGRRVTAVRVPDPSPAHWGPPLGRAGCGTRGARGRVQVYLEPEFPGASGVSGLAREHWGRERWWTWGALGEWVGAADLPAGHLPVSGL